CCCHVRVHDAAHVHETEVALHQLFPRQIAFLIIGEIADPLQSVQYTSNPQLNMFPKAKSRRDTFSQHTLNAGLSWTY
ncbi:MAG: hypothetical protein ACPGXX_10810, partial [Planctomycetaceae bacterium]